MRLRGGLQRGAHDVLVEQVNDVAGLLTVALVQRGEVSETLLGTDFAGLHLRHDQVALEDHVGGRTIALVALGLLAHVGLERLRLISGDGVQQRRFGFAGGRINLAPLKSRQHLELVALGGVLHEAAQVCLPGFWVHTRRPRQRRNQVGDGSSTLLLARLLVAQYAIGHSTGARERLGLGRRRLFLLPLHMLAGVRLDKLGNLLEHRHADRVVRLLVARHHGLAHVLQQHRNLVRRLAPQVRHRLGHRAGPLRHSGLGGVRTGALGCAACPENLSPRWALVDNLQQGLPTRGLAHAFDELLLFQVLHLVSEELPAHLDQGVECWVGAQLGRRAG